MEEMEQPIRAINVEELGAALTAIGKAVSDLADAASTALNYAFDAFQRALDEFEEPDYNPDDPYNVYNIENRHRRTASAGAAADPRANVTRIIWPGRRSRRPWPTPSDADPRHR